MTHDVTIAAPTRVIVGPFVHWHSGQFFPIFQIVKKIAKRTAPSGKKIIFFSDAHLGLGGPEEERAKEDRIVRFLRTVGKQAEHIFIVGDLFDFWFEYKTVIPKGHIRLLGTLAWLRDQGVGITYLAGNHDFWLRDFFPDELGMEICLDPIERTLYGKRFLIHHGDGLLRNDTGYRILKKVLRSRVNIFLFSLVHPDLTGRIARWSSRTSRNHTGKKVYEGNDMVDFARQKLKDGFDVVVMGHNHQSHIAAMEGGTYVNLGDWIDENTYAVYDGKSIRLRRFTDRS
jgi:UDP-2,3-diacylglucosamine hydrolase